MGQQLDGGHPRFWDIQIQDSTVTWIFGSQKYDFLQKSLELLFFIAEIVNFTLIFNGFYQPQ